MEALRVTSAGGDFCISRNELLMINNALNEVCNGPDSVEDWEFSSRIGVERAEAVALLSKIQVLLARMPTGS